MIQSKEVTLYAIEPLAAIIEAVVTNNVGYDPDRTRPFREDYEGTYMYEDGTEVDYGHEHSNLQWHLMRLAHDGVFFDWRTKSEMRLPVFRREEYVIIDLPPQPYLQYPESTPSRQNSN